MILKEALDRSLRGNLPLRFVPPAPKLADIAKRLVDRHGAGERPRKSANELEALLRRLRLVRFDWQKVGAADRLDVAWVLWEGAAPPAEHEAFLIAFLAWLETPWRRLQARRVASSWAAAFDPNLKSIRLVGDWLAARASRLLDPWSGLAEKFDIFSAERGPKKLATAFLVADETEKIFLARHGILGRVAAGGLLLETLGAAAGLVEANLANRPGLAARLAELAVHDGVFRPGAPARRAKAIRQKLAEALLLPWQDETPPGSVKEKITDFLLRHYDDARVQPAVWRDLRAPAADIMRRWLKERTILSFFRLAAKTKGDARSRQEFWLGRLADIDDAWLIAGTATEPDRLRHGRLIGSRPSHAALLLNIGGITILESSHAEGEQVWLPGNELAPRLYRGVEEPYLAAALSTGADFSSAFGRHDGATWQERLQDFIERHRGRAV
jgi:hypothetical protein